MVPKRSILAVQRGAILPFIQETTAQNIEWVGALPQAAIAKDRKRLDFRLGDFANTVKLYFGRTSSPTQFGEERRAGSGITKP